MVAKMPSGPSPEGEETISQAYFYTRLTVSVTSGFKVCRALVRGFSLVEMACTPNPYPGTYPLPLERRGRRYEVQSRGRETPSLEK